MNRTHIKVIVSVVLIMIISSNIFAFAHDAMLNVSYDSCAPATVSNNNYYMETLVEDGLEEWWYDLVYSEEEQEEYRHIGNEVQTIKYYFAESCNGYYWDTDVGAEEAEAIKEAYANSMKQWNNVYYYSYDSNGNRTTHKIANIVEGSANDFNILIYPYSTINANANLNANASASTGPLDNYRYPNQPTLDEKVNGIEHKHYNKWGMFVNVLSFVGESAIDRRVRTGAHEMGHVLGLFDVDKECDFVLPDNHHQELLMMGYESAITRPTYKDIAGVSITRGFHTDDDHRWMIRTKDDGSQYLICSLCNGIRTEYELDEDGTYEGQTPVVYGSCNDNHSLAGGNMLLVATDGTRDFYKCLKCRYIEEAEHAHILGEWEHGDNYSHVKNCAVCDYSITDNHSPIGEWMYKDTYSHKKACEICGGEIIEAHAIRISEVVGNRAPCIYCHRFINIGDNFSQIIHNVQKVSVNGSYILPNGIIVLVDEDVEAYENGTLVFYDKNNLPEMQ